MLSVIDGIRAIEDGEEKGRLVLIRIKDGREEVLWQKKVGAESRPEKSGASRYVAPPVRRLRR